MHPLALVLGDDLAGYNWNHWQTLTPRWINCSPDALWRGFRRYVRNLERAAQQRVCWVATVERSPAGIFHVHALTAGTGRLTDDYLARRWKLGRADVERFDPKRGGAWYTVKLYAATAADDEWLAYDLSRHLPRRRAAINEPHRTGCNLAN